MQNSPAPTRHEQLDDLLVRDGLSRTGSLAVENEITNLSKKPKDLF